MANIKSQIKRIKTNEKARQRNASKKSAIRTAAKKVKLAVEAKDLAKAEELLKAAFRYWYIIRHQQFNGNHHLLRFFIQ